LGVRPQASLEAHGSNIVKRKGTTAWRVGERVHSRVVMNLTNAYENL